MHVPVVFLHVEVKMQFFEPPGVKHVVISVKSFKNHPYRYRNFERHFVHLS